MELTYYTSGRRWYLEPAHNHRVRNPVSPRAAAAAAQLIAEAGGTPIGQSTSPVLAAERERLTGLELWSVSDILRRLGIILRPKD